MKLILEIDTETDKGTRDGDCPCCTWDDDRWVCCISADRVCDGVLTQRPRWCQIKEDTSGE